MPRPPAEFEAVVPSAGLGTRFLPFTERVPKPAIPLLNAPLIHWILAELASLGISRFHLNLHHLPEVMSSAAREFGEDLDISFYHEPVILGTAGLFGKIREGIRSDIFVVANGDVFFSGGVRGLVDDLVAHPEALATLAVMNAPPLESYTRLDVSLGGSLLGFGAGEKFFTGIYAARKELFANVQEGVFSELVKDVLRPALERGERVRAVTYQGLWWDLGSPGQYLDNSLKILKLFSEERLSAPLWPPPESALEAIRGVRVLKHYTAELDQGAEVTGPVVLGPGTRVEAGARVGRSILWDGVRVGAGHNVENSILSTWAAYTRPVGEGRRALPV